MLTLERAEFIGQRVLDLIRPGCKRVIVAGSVRRRMKWVKDIELVAEPILTQQHDLFGPMPGRFISELDSVVAELCQGNSGLCRGRCDGERQKGLLWVNEVPIDLFIVRKPADFSKLLVTQRKYGGAMPPWMRQHEGALRRMRDGEEEVIETPNEEDWFNALGLPRWPAQERTVATLQAWLAKHPATSTRR